MIYKINKVGSGLEDSQCIPYVSEYTDCTDANACSGCTRCSCNEAGKWECGNVVECPHEDRTRVVDDVVLENAMNVLYKGLEKKGSSPAPFVPSPSNSDEDVLIVPDKRVELENELRILMGRQKRSVHEGRDNATVKFYETVDEINEDTLKDLNSSGTMEVAKFKGREIRQMSRRVENFEKNNASVSDLHIEYKQPHELEHHIAENKVDSKHPTEDKINGLSHEEIHKILGNYSEIIKNKELSKLVVNELTRGSERIGDINVVPVSNITFTPENDTLTAMTFIAGNLLNKLWDMEKDANDGSYETEVMKHEKITDLLELFKEPLSLRQENFLKNALEQLSRAIDKNKHIGNISLCANIEHPETIKQDKNNCTEMSEINKNDDVDMADTKINKEKNENKSRVTANAISKINEVLNLMKKYEELQKKLSDRKHKSEFDEKKLTVPEEKNMTMDENVPLNIFGKLLNKITKLLSPNKNNRSINKKLQTYNMLGTDTIAKKNLEKIFNINLDNIEIGAKDKMIIDYLSKTEKHPNCFFTNLQKPMASPLSTVEGSILYNLSEFFKIKSFTDLLNLVNDRKDSKKQHNNTYEINASYPVTLDKNKTSPAILRVNPKNNGTLDLAKNKLKNDIKLILQDLVELQKVQGIKAKTDINIGDVLPCIYNILKSDNDDTYNNPTNNPTSTFKNKITSFIDLLKKDMKLNLPNRRSNSNISPRPKSAVVWERTINNLNKKYHKASRRSSNIIPKNYNELREIMEKVELSGNTYKNFAILSGIAPSERLIFLKTLQADVKQYINAVEAIENSLSTVRNLPKDKQNEFDEFVDNTAMNLNLNKKLVSLLTNLKVKRSERSKPRIINDSNQPLIMVPKWEETNENNNFKLKREQILNQLIMNRLRLYIKTKERSEFDLNSNANYNIAKRILYHLENGNISLAKELYKVFLANKQQHTTGEIHEFSEYPKKETFEDNENPEYREPRLLTFKDPLIRAEDARNLKMLTQDYFLKQLWNLKQLKE